MTTSWLEMRLSVPDEAVDLVSQILVDLGSTGITAADKPLDTFVIPSPDLLGNDPTLKAYFQTTQQPEILCKKVQAALRQLSGIYPELANSCIDYQNIDGQDWANDWKQHFPPFKVGQQLVICPSWADWTATGNETILTLDPGQAFGTGTHATTSLCLDAIAEDFAGDTPPMDVLDVGTGSGILAIASAALGANKVLATDIDKSACQIARDNVNSNQLNNKITVTDRPLEKITGQYQLVLANILASENIRLASELATHLAPGGRLVLSGILIEQEQQVLEGFSDLPLALHSSAHRDEWTCIVYQRHE
jgi:ribosomal protein L11 methyltransferase